MSIRGIGDRWLGGEPVPGVTFGHNDGVAIITGARAGSHGTIALLIRMHPEPEYLVKLAAGAGDVRVRQSALKAAD